VLQKVADTGVAVTRPIVSVVIVVVEPLAALVCRTQTTSPLLTVPGALV
jgi:hypothetical protein